MQLFIEVFTAVLLVFSLFLVWCALWGEAYRACKKEEKKERRQNKEREKEDDKERRE